MVNTSITPMAAFEHKIIPDPAGRRINDIRPPSKPRVDYAHGKPIDFLKPNLISAPTPLQSPKPKSSKLWLYVLVFIIIGMVGFSTKIIISSSEATKNFAGGGVLSQLKNLFVKRTKDIAGATQNRINILLLGIGGEGHDGPYLTDTIILLSIKPKEHQVAMMSIPRDLYVENSSGNGSKINALYSEGRTLSKGEGSVWLKKTVSEVFGVPIHFYGVINFNGFIELVDTLGGINLYVDKSFCDYQYPTLDHLTQTACFELGWQHFDGEQALKYARSRHGNNGEGSDFARSRRQQKIIIAVKDKVTQVGLLLRPDKMDKIFKILGDSIETNMELWEAIKLAQIANEVDRDQIGLTVLDDSPEGPLRATTGIDGAFLLVPKKTGELQTIAQNLFIKQDIALEAPRVILQNGTTVAGLATRAKVDLERAGFTVNRTENADRQSYSRTVIYDLTGGKKSASLEFLLTSLDNSVTANSPTGLSSNSTDADFIIVIGQEV